VLEARTLLKAMQQLFDKERATRKYVYQLFPYDYGQQACKIGSRRRMISCGISFDRIAEFSIS